MSPFYQPEIERGILGACLLYPEAFNVARSELRAEHFYNPSHGFLFAAMDELATDGSGIDANRLIASLRQCGHLDDVGGESMISQLAEQYAFFGAAGMLEYAKDLKQNWARREFVDLGKRAESGEHIDVLNIRAEAIKSECLLAGFRPTFAVLGTFGNRDRKRGLRSGFPSLDKHLSCKGWPIGQLSVICAYHKTGKTAAMLGAALYAAENKRKPLFATFADMSGHDLEDRAMKMLTGWMHAPETTDMFVRWNDQLDRMKSGELPITVYDAAGLESGYDIETFAEAIVSKQPSANFTEVYVDYAQELQSRSRKASTTYEEATVCASVLTRLAHQLNIPIIVGSQITEGRLGERDKTKGSRVWEEKAGLIIRLKRDEEGGVMQERTTMTVAGRFGPGGLSIIRWNKERARFEDDSEGST